MKLSKEQIAKNRETIVEVAARLFRERGVDGVTVAEVMDAAGFTHGGFYNHFSDKGELAVEACCATLAQSVSSAEHTIEEGIGPYVKSYLSPAHRDSPTGCPMTALAGEALRHPELQESYASGLDKTIDLFKEALLRSGQVEPREARARAMRLINEMVGALTLSRAVKVADPKLSNEILRASRDANTEGA